jgi:hypothetical protein
MRRKFSGGAPRPPQATPRVAHMWATLRHAAVTGQTSIDLASGCASRNENGPSQHCRDHRTLHPPRTTRSNGFVGLRERPEGRGPTVTTRGCAAETRAPGPPNLARNETPSDGPAAPADMPADRRAWSGLASRRVRNGSRGVCRETQPCVPEHAVCGAYRAGARRAAPARDSRACEARGGSVGTTSRAVGNL